MPWIGVLVRNGLCSRLGRCGLAPPLSAMPIHLQVRSLEAHMYPEKLKVIAQQVQLQQQQEQVRLLHQEKLEREQQHLRTQVSRRLQEGPLRAASGTSESSRANGNAGILESITTEHYNPLQPNPHTGPLKLELLQCFITVENEAEKV